MRQFWILFAKEYLDRIRTPIFLLSTLLVPLMVLGSLALPGLLQLLTEPTEDRHVLLTDTGTGGAARLTEEAARWKAVRSGRLIFETLTDPAAAEARTRSGEVTAWLAFSPSTNGWLAEVKLASRRSLDLTFGLQLRSAASSAVRHAALASAGLPPERLASLERGERFVETRYDTPAGASSDTLQFPIQSYFMCLMLYLGIVIYSQLLMSSVVVEKNTRVIEILLSSVQPATLMWAKAAGVGALGLTQFSLWSGSWVIFARSAKSPMMTLLEHQPGFGLFAFLLVCFAGGYLIAAAVFLCAGSAVETEQEGGLLVTPLVLLLMVPLGLSFPVSQNPDAISSVVLSLIPVFTPVLMPARLLLSEVPLWQLVLGFVGMALAIAIEFHIAGKIFARSVLSYARVPFLDRWLRWLKLS